MCAQQRQISLGIRPVWSESSLFAWRKLGLLGTHWAQAKTLIRLGGCPSWSESSLGAQSFCWFCHEAAHYYLLFNSVLTWEFFEHPEMISSETSGLREKNRKLYLICFMQELKTQLFTHPVNELGLCGLSLSWHLAFLYIYTSCCLELVVYWQVTLLRRLKFYCKRPFLLAYQTKFFAIDKSYLILIRPMA